MAMLYSVARKLLRVGLEMYFVDLQATGRSVIPETGPVIFAANHPNSIMDTMVLGSQTDRKIAYLARSGLFGNPAVGALFRSMGAIPVYRAQDDPSQLGKNTEAFSSAYELLEEGGALGIFPEGRNSHERRVLELRTGLARIALGAEARNDYSLGVKVIPVGLIFEDRDRFLTSVLVRFGVPIEAQAFAEQHREDPRGAVRAMTDAVQAALQQEAVHIESERTEALVRDVHAIYGRALVRELVGDSERAKLGLFARLIQEIQAHPVRAPNLEDTFWAKQRIADAVEWFQEHDPRLVERVRSDIRRYKDHFSQLQFQHDLLARQPERVSRRVEAIKLTLYALAFAVPAGLGLLGNLLPALLTRAAVMRAPDEAMRAFTAFVVGGLTFPLFYAGVAWCVWEATGAWWAAACVVASLPPTGFFFLRYTRRLARYRDRILVRTLFVSHRIVLRMHMRERERLLRRFDALRKRYMSESGAEEAAG